MKITTLDTPLLRAERKGKSKGAEDSSKADALQNSGADTGKRAQVVDIRHPGVGRLVSLVEKSNVEVDHERLAELRRKIKSGEYKSDAKVIANAVLKEALTMGGLEGPEAVTAAE